MIFTIGHSNKPIEVLLDRLKQNNIQTVWDIRLRPYSRFSPQYNLPNLKNLLPENRIGYEFHGKILGGTEYSETDMTEFHEVVSKLVEQGENNNIAIMCSEGTPFPTRYTPSGCHRWWKITQYILNQFPDVQIQHILMDGSTEKASLADYEKFGIDWFGDEVGRQKRLF